MTPARAFWLARVVTGHRYTISAIRGRRARLPAAAGKPQSGRVVAAWDIGAVALLLLFGFLLLAQGDQEAMARNAEAQQEGEWTVFAITLVGVLVSFAALTRVLGEVKDLPEGGPRELYVAWVGSDAVRDLAGDAGGVRVALCARVLQRTGGAPAVDGGLTFPGDLPPDYWDFLYFALVLGMTFQVSDVQITSRKFRRLAAVHGLIGFLFNAVIIALTVNIAASLL